MSDFNQEHYDAFEEAASEKYDFAEECPEGMRSKGYVTLYNQRVKVCCTPNGKLCTTRFGVYDRKLRKIVDAD